MKVELINKEDIKHIFKNWGDFSCQCYDTPKKYAEKVGKVCLKDSHFSGSRCEYFKFEISGISRVTTAQLNRHSIGVVVNERSMRYCDFASADVVVPPMIANDEIAIELFNNAIVESRKAYTQLQEHFKAKGFTKEKINEDVRYALPLGIETSGTWGFTLEALIHFLNKRLCTRSQWEIRRLANMMKKAVLEVLPELEEYLQPHCEALLYCPEGKSCGIKPLKSEVIQLLSASQGISISQ